MSTDTDDYAKVNIDMSLYTFGDMIDLTASDKPCELCKISGDTTLSHVYSNMVDVFRKPIDGNPIAKETAHSFLRTLLSTVLEVAYNHKVSSGIEHCTFAKKDDVTPLHNNIYRYISWPYMYGNYNAFEDCLPNPYNNSIEAIWQNENRLTIRYIAMNQKGYFVRANIFIFILP